MRAASLLQELDRVLPQRLEANLSPFTSKKGGGQVGIAHFQKPSEVSWLNDVDCHLCCQGVWWWL